MTETIETHQEDIGGLIRRLETNYISGFTRPSKYVTMSLSDDVNRIYAYLESKHTSGETDSMGRDKPFFNIVLASRNIWFRATDIDRKDIKFKATKQSEVLLQFVATAMLQDWMRRENFGQFLNDLGINMAGFNETIVEFVEKDGRLIPSIIPWNRIICDSIDFANNPKIKVIELTEAQLYKNKIYDQKVVKALCDARQTRKTLERQNKDNNNSNYIKLYELHGELSNAQYKKAKGIEPIEGDDDIFFQQIHVLSFVETDTDGEYEKFTLYSGKENNPHLIGALLPEVDGSIALRGSVKSQFDAQWMVNHTAKAIKDQLDLASKLIFQTSDGTFVGQNALFAIESGDILIHALNQPLTKIDNNSHDISSLQEYGKQWQAIGGQQVGISESMLGINPPSGTAWRQTNALLEESHSLFEIMTENKGLFIEEMLRTFVIPFFKKQLKNSKEIATTLHEYGIDKIDATYIQSKAVQKMMNEDINAVLNGQQPKQDLQGAKQQIQDQMSAQGSQRFLKPSDISNKTWADLFKDFEWKIECDITGENTPDKEDLATLSTVLQTISSNPRVLSDPNAKLIFNRILEIAGGISPLQLADAQPFVIPPSKKLTETMDYKDVPDDVKRQIEQQAGLQPSQQQTQPTPSPIQAIQPKVGA